MKAFVLLAAACALAHPFGLEFEDDETFGHHGKPAAYGKSKVVMDPLAALLSEFWMEDVMENPMGMMDPFGEHSMEKSKLAEKKEMDDDADMLIIMESTPEMCPLCMKEGHALGHEDHKLFLAKLRRKLLAEDKIRQSKIAATKAEVEATMESCELCKAAGHIENHEEHLKEMSACPFCKAAGSHDHHKEHRVVMEEMKDVCPMCKAEGNILKHAEHEKEMKGCALCQAEGNIHNRSEHSCALCKAEGNTKDHAMHKKLFAMAKELEFEQPKMEKKHMDCLLCKHEGTEMNHHKHIELAKILKIKASMEHDETAEMLRHQEKYRTGMARISNLLDDHRDMMIAAKAEAQFKKDREEASSPMIIMSEFDFDWDWEEPAMKMEMKMPARDFKRRAGEPADADEDEEEEEHESLLDAIMRNISDLFGSFSDSDMAGAIAIFLIFFVGILLTSLGIVEIIAHFSGESSGMDYAPLSSLDVEERMILEMEDGMVARPKGHGSISI